MVFFIENILALSSPSPQQYTYLLNMANGPGEEIENKINLFQVHLTYISHLK